MNNKERDENGIYIGDIEQDRSKKPIFKLFPEDNELAAEGKCVVCKQTFTLEQRAKWSIPGQREWYISSTCEPCFDKIFEDDDESGESQEWLDETTPFTFDTNLNE